MRTEVGYAGGEKPKPTYHDLGFHAEVLEVEFDPSVLSFAELTRLFWEGHDPTSSRTRSQYRPILICTTAEQFEFAEADVEQRQSALGREITTEVMLGKTFWTAEDYHQKWMLRRHKALFADARKNFESEWAFIRSFAGTKLNAIAARQMGPEETAKVVGALDLSKESLKRIDWFLERRQSA